MPQVDQDRLKTVMGAPIPGQSLTGAPKNAAWEKPPQFTKVDEAMNYIMDQVLEPQYIKQLFGLMSGGMSIEAIVRVLIFSGFTSGKWTPDLGIMLYKPLMFTLITLAKMAGLTNTPIVLKQNLEKYAQNKFQQGQMFEQGLG